MLNFYKRLFRFSSQVVKQGEGFNLKFNLYVDSQPKSFWHDVKLKTDKNDEFNIVVEIPRLTLAKYELATNQQHNPLIWDSRKSRFDGKEELRYYAQFGFYSYGFFPQTWESSIDAEAGYIGDNDPLDALEIGSLQYNIGDIVRVKVLGALCLIDQGEIDWKVLCLNVEEAQRRNIASIPDIEKEQPGLVKAITNYFKYIKTFDAKKPNSYLYDESYHSPDKAVELIQEYNHLYEKLFSGDVKYQKLRQEFK